MGTLLMFTDDSKQGNAHHEIGVIIAPEKLRILQRKLQSLAKESFVIFRYKSWVPLHASAMWNRKTETRDGGFDWSEISEAELQHFFTEAVTLIDQYVEQIKQVRVRTGGQEGVKYPIGHERFWAIYFLMQKLDSKLRPEGDIGLLFADRIGDRKHEATFGTRLHSFVVLNIQKGHHPPVQNVLTPIHFVNSTQSTGIQVADLVAYILMRASSQNPNPGPTTIFMRSLKSKLTKFEDAALWP